MRGGEAGDGERDKGLSELMDRWWMNAAIERL